LGLPSQRTVTAGSLDNGIEIFLRFFELLSHLGNFGAGQEQIRIRIVSSRKVFGDTLAASGAARTKQKALFVVSALIGLGLTTIIVGAADFGGINPRVAKLVAIAASFALTWVLRSRVVFRGAVAA